MPAMAAQRGPALRCTLQYVAELCPSSGGRCSLRDCTVLYCTLDNRIIIPQVSSVWRQTDLFSFRMYDQISEYYERCALLFK